MDPDIWALIDDGLRGYGHVQGFIGENPALINGLAAVGTLWIISKVYKFIIIGGSAAIVWRMI